MRRYWIIGLVLVLSGLTAAPVAAGDQVERPFKSTDSGILVEDESACDISSLPLVVCPIGGSGTGNATHLGKTSVVTEAALFVIFVPGSCFLPDGSPGVAFEQVGSFVTTAANRDEVHGDFVTMGCAGLLDPFAPIEYTGVTTITGGTGRFAGATGSATTTGVSVAVDNEVSAFEQTSEGTITY